MKTPMRKKALASGMQQGFSMIEMLVSVAIGLVVSGAVLYTVSASQVSSRHQDAQARMHDAGQMALAQLSEHARMTGFWVPTSEVLATDGPMSGQSPLRGCRNGFIDPGADWGALNCAAGTGNDALALRFQVHGSGRNWDCAGNELTSNAMQLAAQHSGGATTPSHLLRDEVQEVYYVANSASTGNPALFCRTPSSATPVQLVDNVDRFEVRYAVADPNPEVGQQNTPFDVKALTGAAVRYLRADQMAACDVSSGKVPANSWCSVVGMRVCLVLRTEDGINAEPSPWLNCEGGTVNATDRRHRQAFNSVVTMRNRVVMP
ncbi:MAG: PilW family protein [Lautropia sp.]|nr:PilW family protein [Lautropia sp.]